jgi:hypothetical protein
MLLDVRAKGPDQCAIFIYTTKKQDSQGQKAPFGAKLEDLKIRPGFSPGAAGLPGTKTIDCAWKAY